MTDYYPPIQRAVQGLAPNTPEARRAMYDRARTALLKQLRGMNPPLAEDQIARERMLLEDAVRRVEEEMVAQQAASASASDDEVLPEPLQDESFEPEARQDLTRNDLPRQDVARRGTPVEAARPGRARASREPAVRNAQREPSGGAQVRPVREPGPSRGRLIAAGAAVVLVLAAGGVAAWTAMRSDTTRTALLVPATTPTQTPAQPQPSGKLLDRISPNGDQAGANQGSGNPGTEQAAPAQSGSAGSQATANPADSGARAVQTTVVTNGTAQSLAPVANDAPPVAQRAVMYEEEAGGAQGGSSVGAVTWRTESVAGDASGPLDLAIRGEVDIPERKLKAMLTLRRNSDPALPATHTLQIQFTVPKDFPNGGISNVPGVLMKVAEAQRGAPLAGLSVKVTNGYFLIGLNDGPADKGRNEQLLRERDWIDIPMQFDDGKRAILTIDKGVPGQRAFNDAFASWSGGAQTAGAAAPVGDQPAAAPSTPDAGGDQE